jgi:hypothetical protein
MPLDEETKIAFARLVPASAAPDFRLRHEPAFLSPHDRPMTVLPTLSITRRPTTGESPSATMRVQRAKVAVEWTRQGARLKFFALRESPS